MLNGNQDRRFSLGVGHIKSLVIGLADHVYLKLRGGLISALLIGLPKKDQVFRSPIILDG